MIQNSGFLKILLNRNFLKLWISQFFSQPANNMLTFVLAIRIFEITGSSFIVSLLVALVSIPPILFSSTAGVLADSLNRKYILFFSNLLRGIIVIGLVFYGDSYFAILVLAFLISVVSVFFSPAQTACIPTLTNRENLFAANSLFLFTLYGSFLLGYSLAGPLLYWFGDGIYYIMMAAFVIASFFNLILPSLNHYSEEKEEKTEEITKNMKQSFNVMWKKLLEGIIYIKNNPLILITFFQITFVFAVERAVIALVPEFGTQLLHFDVSQIGYFLITPVGLGALFGAIITNRLKAKFKKRTIILMGVFINSVTLSLLPLYETMGRHAVDFGFAASFFWFLICYIVILSFFSGMADVTIIVTAQTMLQEETQNEKQGRIFGNLTMLMNLVGLPVVLLVGFLTNYYPVSKIVLFLGIFTFVVAILSLIASKKKLDPWLKSNNLGNNF